ncbi:hypothetical protein [Nonomuraea sp. NEAU-A123]|uniref:hypothetical protein n=1 Tax=Nonomuraea sp. NEAU-A123 TaxID=2839649 RepID=UPI001BE4DD6E|nr:hypothetical protein [Nonomuraea sp. NEAU-A123]MBT2232400.1 hypothetical protein [Nonomuraea sp. NEAU-A123]
MNDSATLEQRYRRLLRAYPRTYREQHGEELLSTLMEAADPETRRPAIREALPLLAGGFAAHARDARSRAPWWVDGLHLGVLAVATTTYAMKVDVLPHLIRPIWIALAILLLVALTRGWLRLALPLAIVAVVQASGLAARMGVPRFGPAYVETSNVVPHVVIVAGLAILAIGRRGKALPARSWLWLLIPVSCWMLQFVDFSFEEELPWLLFRSGVEVLALSAVLWATVAAKDARWSLAAAIYMIPGLAYLAENLPAHGRKGFAYWGLLTLLVVASAVAARRTRRRI